MDAKSATYDLAILGAGISCTLTLYALLSKLTRSSKPLRILVVERDPQFWRGYPYGDRSSPNSLIITTLGEFVPDAERDDFVAWLEAERPRWSEELRLIGGQIAQRWLHENDAAMDARDWNEIYIPRFLYGRFAEARLARLVTDAESAGLARITLMHGEVVDLEPLPRGHRIVFADTAEPPLDARLVLLTIGSPPFSALAGAETSGCLHIADAYSPSLPENLGAIRRRLAQAPAGQRNLLVIGSNATSLELLYMISGDNRLRAHIDKVVVLSTGGALPHKMTRERFRTMPFPHMNALREASSLRPRDIVVAAETDIAALDPVGDRIGDTFHHLSSLLVELMKKLGPTEQKEFHVNFGMQFTRLVRRAGAEYREAAERLLESGKLELMRGWFVRLKPAKGADAARLVWSREKGGLILEDPRNFAGAVNCMGFEELSDASRSPLIANLIRRRIAMANDTRRGFAVDDSFQTTDGVFLSGPLLGGIFNSKAQFWHVENVRRIHELANSVSSAILDRIRAA